MPFSDVGSNINRNGFQKLHTVRCIITMFPYNGQNVHRMIGRRFINEQENISASAWPVRVGQKSHVMHIFCVRQIVWGRWPVIACDTGCRVRQRDSLTAKFWAIKVQKGVLPHAYGDCGVQLERYMRGENRHNDDDISNIFIND